MIYFALVLTYRDAQGYGYVRSDIVGLEYPSESEAIEARDRLAGFYDLDSPRAADIIIESRDSDRFPPLYLAAELG